MNQTFSSLSEDIANPNRVLWEKGDFTRVAGFMRESGELFAGTLGVTPFMRILDLGCGDGTTAIPLARLGADVLGVDIARNLVDAGNRQARQRGLQRLRFQQGDACNLHELDDHSFDLTVSMFGAMFAPKPFDVACEMVRVTRPGGRIVMGNWIPGDPTFVSQLLRVSSAFMPPPPDGFISPMQWGVDRAVVDRFGKAGIPRESISIRNDTYYFISPDRGPKELIDICRRFYGPTMNAFDAAERSGRSQELLDQLLDLANSLNKSTKDGTLIPATFLRVTVSL